MRKNDTLTATFSYLVINILLTIKWPNTDFDKTIFEFIIYFAVYLFLIVSTYYTWEEKIESSYFAWVSLEYKAETKLI